MLWVSSRVLTAHARRGQRGLGAGMATADDDHIEMVLKLHECVPRKAQYGLGTIRQHGLD